MSQVLQFYFEETGVVKDYAGSVPPPGYLLCDGQAVSRTEYARLFAVIGTAWGDGDGSTTFNLPDLRGRVTAGKDDMGGTAAGRLTPAGSGVDGATLGATGGEETHTLTTPEIPSHTHRARSGWNYNNNEGAYTGAWATGTYAGMNTANIEATGGGGAHNNVQPTAVMNKIIKT